MGAGDAGGGRRARAADHSRGRWGGDAGEGGMPEDVTEGGDMKDGDDGGGGEVGAGEVDTSDGPDMTRDGGQSEAHKVEIRTYSRRGCLRSSISTLAGPGGPKRA
jgi:hypothetical protein